MRKFFILICFSFFLNTTASAFINGTLAITMGAAPTGGLSLPRVMVLQDFHSVYHNTVNWGDTWSQSIPSGRYKIFPLPVWVGSVAYMANSVVVIVPPSGSINPVITYHSI